MTNLVSLDGSVIVFHPGAVAGPVISSVIAAVASGAVLFLIVRGIRAITREVQDAVDGDREDAQFYKGTRVYGASKMGGNSGHWMLDDGERGIRVTDRQYRRFREGAW